MIHIFHVIDVMCSHMCIHAYFFLCLTSDVLLVAFGHYYKCLTQSMSLLELLVLRGLILLLLELCRAALGDWSRWRNKIAHLVAKKWKKKRRDLVPQSLWRARWQRSKASHQAHIWQVLQLPNKGILKSTFATQEHVWNLEKHLRFKIRQISEHTLNFTLSFP